MLAIIRQKLNVNHSPKEAKMIFNIGGLHMRPSLLAPPNQLLSPSAAREPGSSERQPGLASVSRLTLVSIRAPLGEDGRVMLIVSGKRSHVVKGIIRDLSCLLRSLSPRKPPRHRLCAS